MTEEAFHADLEEALGQRGAEATLKLAALYERATQPQRQALRRDFPFGRRWRLPELGTILLPLAGEVSPERRVRAALVLQLIENGRMDYRDNLVTLAVLYHAALRLALDVDALFSSLAGMGDEPMGGLLREFLKRSPVDRSLWAFGWAERPTAGGLRFEWIGDDDDYANRCPAHLTALGQIANE